VDEIAAMLDGVPLTEASRANARSMLERTVGWKSQRRAAPAAPPPALLGKVSAPARGRRKAAATA
jgi:hypothetical protein